MSQYTTSQLLDLARCDGQLFEFLINSPSGTDQAESEFFRLRRLFWLDLMGGVEHGEARAKFVSQWRAYAEQNNAKVNAAPKIKRGPSAGHSAISHRWVSPEKAELDVVVLQARAVDGGKLRSSEEP